MPKSSGLAMSWEEWSKKDGIAIADLIRKRKISAREVARQVAAGVELVNPKLEGVLEVFDDVVKNPDADKPAKDGRLYGVPIFLKDLGSGLKGRKRESGSKFDKDQVAKETDPNILNFLSAGLVPIGRSTTPEFGMTFDTATDYLGRVKVTRNPWNLKHTPGGSSGGSAAMVAARVTPISMASDGGGSTRIPASFCGLVGLKATRGMVPRPWKQSEYMVRISAEGVVTRSVRDTAAAYDYITKVPNGGSFMNVERYKGSYLAAIKKDPRKLKIGLSTGNWGRPGKTDEQVAARVREVGRLMQKLGHRVEELDDSKICDWDQMWSSYYCQWIGSRAQFRTMAADRGINTPDLRDYLGPMVHRHLEAADRYDKYDIWKMMGQTNTVMRGFGATLEKYDVLLTPTLAIRVPEANGPYSLLRNEALDPWLDRLANACRYTMPGNEAGLPGISVPAGLDTDGLPIGAMFYGNWSQEALLLQIARQIEKAKPEWFDQSAPLNVAAAG
ncbi:MAG: amidase [Alphaproteobacteria bacterium]|nr:amidase [Alphaproteobacteria bacterium]